jgi:hypothetical protein
MMKPGSGYAVSPSTLPQQSSSDKSNNSDIGMGI